MCHVAKAPLRPYTISQPTVRFAKNFHMNEQQGVLGPRPIVGPDPTRVDLDLVFGRFNEGPVKGSDVMCLM